MEPNLPRRKHSRWKEYDYSSPGAYFVTICTQNKRNILSRIVGRGLAPADPSNVEYTVLGRIAEEQLLLLETRYPYIKIERYVIMPNHIHILFTFGEKAAGASPRPTLTEIVGVYKSLTTRIYNQRFSMGKIFQTSFYEHVIRDLKDFEDCYNYISLNPARWHSDDLYNETV